MTFWKTSVSTFAIAAMAALPLSAQSTGEEETDTQPQSVMEVEEGTSETTGDTAQGTTEGATTETGDPAMDTLDTATEGADTATDTAQDDGSAEASGAVEGTIAMQDENTVLGTDLMGAAVYNPQGETIGDINDMIVSIEGQVEGVVIGVGGFLGMGEKDVAVDMASFTLQETEFGEPRLVLDTTAEQLEAADEFVTAAERREAQQIEENQATGYDGTSSGSTDAGTTN
ncbi:PRC-barrel domain-containing protein [Roseovarius sp. MMSF_3281]|uniref:PRC-barrel domain-containing protein n=1 Tax=Roseovarius sp. MMSF_3281 TaxID=3046694 RepID=UPI00273D903B|nr:PRC-barrel domain-containing protein [Roseovarius sp. MMSF_3281]